MERASIEFLLFVIILLASITRGSQKGFRLGGILSGRGQEPCGSYGCSPLEERFVPAPRGQTPDCAKNGQTFCETIEHYPQQIIRHLIDDKCSFDFTTGFRDDSSHDVSFWRSKPENHQRPGYPRPGFSQSYLPSPELPQYPPLGGPPATSYGTPLNDTHHGGYDYSPPASSQGKIPVKDQTPSTLGPNFRPFDPTSYGNGQMSPEQRWNAIRYSRHTGQEQSPHDNPFQQFGRQAPVRNKRQTNPESGFLCPTKSQFITPRAALNSQGDWKYVVNLLEANEKFSQSVQSEVCQNVQCRGLCHPPEGYVSRCEQKYVQKRLVALEGTGNQLYTDIFWFPHGCACNILPEF